MNKVYLAGKAHGDKWDLIRNVNESKCKFVASDDDGHSEHGWGVCPGYGDLRDEVARNCIRELVDCNYMIAFIDQEGAYGTIAEVAFYSAIISQTRPCYLILQQTGENNISDSTWLISNFPKVIPLVTQSFKQSKALVEKIASIESPIEYQFWDAFISMGMFHHGYLQPQAKIGKYRADFLFEDAKIIVELDGHDYHSSKEQRTYDAQRDRFIADQGYQVIRFTGSEIYKDATKCAHELHGLGIKNITGKHQVRPILLPPYLVSPEATT